MSVEKVQRAAGQVWRVRWRDDDGKPHSRVIGRKTDALAFDEELKRAKRRATSSRSTTPNPERRSQSSPRHGGTATPSPPSPGPRNWPTPQCWTSTSSPPSASCRSRT